MTLTAAKRLAPVAAVFVLDDLASGDLRRSRPSSPDSPRESLPVGECCSEQRGRQTPTVPPVAIAMAVTVVKAVASAVPLRGLADLHPEMAQGHRGRARRGDCLSSPR